MTLRILHLEDSPDDSELVRVALRRSGLDCHIRAVNSGRAFLDALSERFDVILSDSGIPGYDGQEALQAARTAWPDVPFIVVSGHVDPQRMAPAGGERASGHVPKHALQSLAATIGAVLAASDTGAAKR